MPAKILSKNRFKGPAAGWDSLHTGLLEAAADKSTALQGPGVHVRNGDTIELRFAALEPRRGQLHFGFSGGMEKASVTLDFKSRRLSLSTSEWSRPQPVAENRFRLRQEKAHTLRLEKREGRGRRVKLADIDVYLDGEKVLAATDVDILPEIGVAIGVTGTQVQLQRFVHRGPPSHIPEYLHVGAWQALNQPDIEANLAALCRGLEAAAEKGIRLLVTPETSLTGLFPTHRVTRDRKAVATAEDCLRRFLAALPDAPFLVAGLPVWEQVPGHRRRTTRYNASRVYDPDGHIAGSYAKIHSCETEFWHGCRLQEFEVDGAPICMHICHDGRYPDVWTLPVMFGARLVLHPSNGGTVGGSVDAFEKQANRSTQTSHAFYVHVNGGGGSFIAGPQKYDNVLAVSTECRRDVDTFPAVGKPRECLLETRLRLDDAFGYWPVRSFRVSEEAAEAYESLYGALGGGRLA